jgi:cell division protein FtsB
MKAPLVRLAYAVTLLLIAGYAANTLCGPRGIAVWLDKQRQIHQLEKRNAGLAQEIERKREHIKRLSDNPAEQELEIRERLKLAHPNDKIFIIEPQDN